MRRFGLSCLAVLVVLTSAQLAEAKKADKASAAKAPKVKGPAPVAKEADVKEFKGEFTWGMTPQQVIEKLEAKVDASYKDKVEKYRADPMQSDKLRRQIKTEKDTIAKSLVKFEGQGAGIAWSTSIIDEEFVPNNAESMLVYREDKSRRYFFFAGESLYKMFVAFDKEVIAGKTFVQFGELMQQKYGKAQAVYRDVVAHGVKDRVLDSYQWRSPQGDGLRLVDRSKFYDVYCLVIYDNNVAERQAEVRKSRASATPKGSFVDSVITDKASDRDENDNVIDRITGKDVLKPGERRGPQQNIKVPSPTGAGSKEMGAEDR